MTWNLVPLPALATDRVTLILNNLLVFIASKYRPGVDMALLALICRRVERIRNRFAALVVRHRAGTLRPPRGRVARLDARPEGVGRPPRPPWPLPTGWAWLCAIVPSWAAGCGSQLAHLMSDPQMVALLTDAPRAGRLLRPLFWMLGQKLPDILRPAPRPRAAGRPGVPGRDVPGATAPTVPEATARTLPEAVGRTDPAAMAGAPAAIFPEAMPAPGPGADAFPAAGPSPAPAPALAASALPASALTAAPDPAANRAQADSPVSCVVVAKSANGYDDPK